ncbi:hypothetical protein [Falsirhodobacter sp. alg1]|uniref:hypothetical protein n=1 Tax=Falsirhodobacter sp. alg1 TaxID=1472418 RepID=UPI0005EFE574|nr:hypothetical protein [Falsirhodobacter sp. alg1]
MFWKMTRHMALAGAMTTLTVWPAAAVMPADRGAEPVDLAYYDSITRTGVDQLPTDPYCANPEMLGADLGEAYGEEVILSSSRSDGRKFDVWASDQQGTWTVSYTRPDGIACVIGSGTGWTGESSAKARLIEVGLTR